MWLRRSNSSLRSRGMHRRRAQSRMRAPSREGSGHLWPRIRARGGERMHGGRVSLRSLLCRCSFRLRRRRTGARMDGRRGRRVARGRRRSMAQRKCRIPPLGYRGESGRSDSGSCPPCASSLFCPRSASCDTCCCIEVSVLLLEWSGTTQPIDTFPDLLAHTPQTSPIRPLVQSAVDVAASIAAKCDRAQDTAEFFHRAM